ncbi:beta-ketoacyl-[acyl-carrier-protein] synthase family protein [Streptomyces montanus]|uniref:Beta-ketoacyl-[acyl-carrier-protein] synthase family protein n=1 Tax=Streptomyces montanus TaxID=2580423 RepID=A0A5R9FQC3_9ACTN|nr:beta-ketoacyl-[acyl-carrier-protein] synthase family protein [Streptomyces montanus]TLS46127.1 beta-ketoacyl-[acyl-carrier-protein] synthase family protein [Streptomyces montanus]
MPALSRSRPAPRHRVVVTGMGALTPLGATVKDTWAAVMNGESGITKLDTDWAADLPVKIAGILPTDPADVIGRVAARRLDRSQQIAVAASRAAWADAGAPPVEPERLAAVIGSGVGGAQTLLDQHDLLHTDGRSKVSPYTVPRLMPNGAAGAVSILMGARAGAHAPTSACASGAEALVWGSLLIAQGMADVVIAGGTDACIAPISVTAFDRIRALSRLNDEPERASRPFDQDRDGFVMAEGAGVVVLEREDHARARGARIHAVLAGSGVTADATSPTNPDIDGQVRAIHQALANADLRPRDIEHVNAHATGTPLGDCVEAQALARAIGTHPAITATKSYTGHLLGAAGAVEAIMTILAMQQGIVPRIRNLNHVDDRIDLDLVQEAHRATTPHAALSSSFGFGGHNVILALTRE